MDEPDKLKISLRENLLTILKQPSPEILRYIVEESEICEILIAKLTEYYTLLPTEVELIRGTLGDYPEDEDARHSREISLMGQIQQAHAKRMQAFFIEFIRFIVYIDQCASCIQH